MPNLYSKAEFPYARPLAHAILTDVPFRQWFLAKTKFADLASDARPLAELQAELRTTANAKKWWWFNYFCHAHCSCKVETGIETDILIVLEARKKFVIQANGTKREFRYAIHIEVKPPGSDLEPGQAESYPQRAECWANRDTRYKRVVEHDDFTTLLVCGENLRTDDRRKHFNDTKFHGEIEQRITPYPDLTDLRNE
jgi:hypothetical protein